MHACRSTLEDPTLQFSPGDGGTTVRYPGQNLFSADDWATLAISDGVLDDVPPTVQLTSPESGDVLSGTATLEATASDNVGVNRVEFWYIDGSSEQLVGADPNAPFSVPFDTTAYPDTTGAEIAALAFDASGNVSVQSSASVSINNTGPKATITITGTAATKGGAQSVPIAGIPLDAIRGATNGGPPSAPLGGIPLGGIPLGGIPLGGIPLGGIPLGGIGLTPANLAQNGLGGVPLSSIPLKAPDRWESHLVGTRFAGKPLNDVTLAQLLATAPAALSAPSVVTLSSLDLSASPLGGIPLGGIALGGLPLGGIPLGGISTSTTLQNLTDWCAYVARQPGFTCTDPNTLAGQTVIGLALQGVPLGGIPLGGIPLGGIPLGGIPLGGIPIGTPLGGIPLGGIDLTGTPLGGIPLGGIDMSVSPLGGIPLGGIPLSARAVVLICNAGFICADTATLAQAKAAGAINRDARIEDLGVFKVNGQPLTLADLIKGLPADTTLADLIGTVISRAAYDWEGLPLNAFPLQDFSPDGGVTDYTVDYTIPASPGDANTAVIRVLLPRGTRYVVASARSDAGTTVGEPVFGGRLPNLLTFPIGGAEPGTTGQLRFKVRAGLTLGSEAASASISGAEFATQTTPTPASTQIGPTFDPNASPTTAPVIQPDTLVMGYTTSGSDRNYFRIAAPAAGVQRVIHLSHLHSDVDLVVYGGAPAPLRSPTPAPVGPQLPNVPFLLQQRVQAITPEVLTDVLQQPPAGQSVLGVSDNRGLEDEEVTLNTPEDSGGMQTIQVSSFDGARSDEPWMLRVEDIPALPLPAGCSVPPLTGVGTANPLPTIPAGATTLYLINSKRYGDLYGAAAETTVLTKLRALASRSDAAGGAVVPVEGNAAVASAYSTWLSTPANYCSPGKANDIVRAIGSLLDQIVTPSVKYIVVVGDGSVVPFGHILDNTSYANERGYASTFFSTTAGNEYLSSYALGFFLTDDALGDNDYVGSGPYVPELGVGRLVETPAQITAQIDQYVTRNGAIAPTAALTTGYDFLTDGAQAIADSQSRFGAANGSLINETWTKANALTALGLGATGAQIASLNAHYDHNRALPADQNAAGTETDLLTTSSITPGSVAGRLIFTMGCHSGLPVADSVVAAALRPDWAQAYAAGGAIGYLGNTGFGLGDTAGVAYSEKLNALFAERLDGSLTIGQALLYAKQEYAADAPASGYHLKVLDQATMFGLPMYRVGTGTTPTAPPYAPTRLDPATGLTSSLFNVSPTFTLRTTPIGGYYTVGGTASFDNRRPIEPIAKVDVTEPDLVAHGALITSLASTEETGFDAAFSRVVDDLSALSPELGGDAAYPTRLQTISKLATPYGDRQRLVLFAGQFRSDGSAPTVGMQRRFTTLSGSVLYSPPSDLDFREPAFGPVDVAAAASSVAFGVDIDAADPGDVKRVLVLYRDSGPAWKSVDLARIGTTSRWTGAGPVTGTNVEWYMQAADGAGNVGVTSNKATVKSLVQPPPVGSIAATLTGTQSGGWYTTPVGVTISGAPGITFSLDSGDPVTGTSLTVSGTGVHVLDFRGSDGSHGIAVIPIDVTPPSVAVGPALLPVGTAPSVLCTDAGSGVATCTSTPATLPTTLGAHTVHISATDVAGNRTEADRTYSNDQFTGFFSPVNNPPTLNTIKAGSAVPVKFSLGLDLGLSIFQTGYPKSQRIACDSSAPQDAVEETVTAGNSTLTYEAGSNQYHYVWKTDKSWGAGSCRQLILRFLDGTERVALFQLK